MNVQQIAARLMQDEVVAYPTEAVFGLGCNPLSESAVRKLMILVNGRAENMLKWTELAYDFYQQGYDVLLFDHRGQGYSQRIIPQKGHLDEFRFYTDDMAKIIEKTTALYAYQAQYILAHSLGALISTYYLANYDHHIKKAVLSSPF